MAAFKKESRPTPIENGNFSEGEWELPNHLNPKLVGEFCY